MSISQQEVTRLITKIREKYSEYSSQNSGWFNPEPFEDRLRMAVSNRMNMEGFILAEIANFEKLRESYEKKKKGNGFSKQIQNIIDENTARIRKYPQIDFHPRAGFEISHFYGAMAEFSLGCFPVFRILKIKAQSRDRAIEIERQLEFLAGERGSRPSRRIEDHVMILSRKGVPELDIERDASAYLRECAFVLHDAADLAEALIEERSDEWESPLNFSGLYLEDSRKKKLMGNYSGMTGYGALMFIRDRAYEIIEDFRLGAFRK